MTTLPYRPNFLDTLLDVVRRIEGMSVIFDHLADEWIGGNEQEFTDLSTDETIDQSSSTVAGGATPILLCKIAYNQLGKHPWETGATDEYVGNLLDIPLRGGKLIDERNPIGIFECDRCFTMVDIAFEGQILQVLEPMGIPTLPRSSREGVRIRLECTSKLECNTFTQLIDHYRPNITSIICVNIGRHLRNVKVVDYVTEWMVKPDRRVETLR